MSCPFDRNLVWTNAGCKQVMEGFIESNGTVLENLWSNTMVPIVLRDQV